MQLVGESRAYFWRFKELQDLDHPCRVCLSSHSRAFLAFISKEAIGAGAYALAPENISTQKVILSVQVANHRLQVMGMLVGLKRANPRESQV